MADRTITPRDEKRTRTCGASKRRKNRPDKIDPHQLYCVEQAAAALDIGRSTFYQLIAAEKIRVVRISNRTRVSGSEIIGFIERAAA